MSRIKLSSNSFSIVPEGTHIFEITDVDYKEEFGKLEIKMKTAEGDTHTERFSFRKANGKDNEGALNAFSYFARTALNDYNVEDLDPAELVGKFIECDVEHETTDSTKTPGKMVTFSRLGDKRPASGFTNSPESHDDLDLDDLLG